MRIFHKPNEKKINKWPFLAVAGALIFISFTFCSGAFLSLLGWVIIFIIIISEWKLSVKIFVQTAYGMVRMRVCVLFGSQRSVSHIHRLGCHEIDEFFSSTFYFQVQLIGKELNSFKRRLERDKTEGIYYLFSSGIYLQIHAFYCSNVYSLVLVGKCLIPIWNHVEPADKLFLFDRRL